MRCKCGKLVDPSYEQMGKCEDCYVNACDNLACLEEDDVKPENMRGAKALELPVSDLDLSDRVTNSLSSAGIIFIKFLVSKTGKELKKIRMIGDKGVAEIKLRLEEFGLALKQESEPTPGI